MRESNFMTEKPAECREEWKQATLELLESGISMAALEVDRLGAT